jgi:hypothetical protein
MSNRHRYYFLVLAFFVSVDRLYSGGTVPAVESCDEVRSPTRLAFVSLADTRSGGASCPVPRIALFLDLTVLAGSLACESGAGACSNRTFPLLSSPIPSAGSSESREVPGRLPEASDQVDAFGLDKPVTSLFRNGTLFFTLFGKESESERDDSVVLKLPVRVESSSAASKKAFTRLRSVLDFSLDFARARFRLSSVKVSRIGGGVRRPKSSSFSSSASPSLPASSTGPGTNELSKWFVVASLGSGSSWSSRMVGKGLRDVMATGTSGSLNVGGVGVGGYADGKGGYSRHSSTTNSC